MSREERSRMQKIIDRNSRRIQRLRKEKASQWKQAFEDGRQSVLIDIANGKSRGEYEHPVEVLRRQMRSYVTEIGLMKKRNERLLLANEALIEAMGILMGKDPGFATLLDTEALLLLKEYVEHERTNHHRPG